MVMGKKGAEHRGRICSERILARAETPIVHKGTLTEGVRLDYLVGGYSIYKLACRLPCLYDLEKELEVYSISIQQMSLASGEKLGGEKLG